MSRERISLGIDLGNTSSRSSFDGNACALIIDDLTDKSDNKIPSCVYYKEYNEPPLVGWAAESKYKTKSKSKPDNCNFLYNWKKYIGKYYSEIEKEKLKKFPFKIIERENNPYYEVKFEHAILQISPMIVFSEIMKYVKKKSFKETVYEKLSEDDIFIAASIPAFFTKKQKEEAIEAVKLAGIKNIELINGPSAAVLAYLSANENEIIKKNDCNILVYDFGGYTFDTSIVNVKDNEISMKECGGDTNLGGEDLTDLLFYYIIEDIMKTMNIDIRNNCKLCIKLREECENAKIMLSVSEEYEREIDLPNGENYSIYITRSLFNAICKDIIDKTMCIVMKILNEAKMTYKDIDYVILVGGSSNIKRIEEFISNNFRNSQICKGVNPDEAVARGCALYSKYQLTGEYPYRII